MDHSTKQQPLLHIRWTVTFSIGSTHTLRQPSTNLISHIARAFNRLQPIPHGVTEAMHGVALPNRDARIRATSVAAKLKTKEYRIHCAPRK